MNKELYQSTVKRTESFAFCRFRRNEDPPLALLRPIRCASRRLRLGLSRQHSEAVCDQSERGQNTSALLLRSLRKNRSKLGVCHPFVDLRWVRHPLDYLLGRRPKGQQVSEDLLRRLGEKLTLLVAGRLVERGRDCLGFGLPAKLLGRPPIGATVVQRIEDNVATTEVIEAEIGRAS